MLQSIVTHNKFEIKVIDAITGKTKKEAVTYNVVTDTALTTLLNNLSITSYMFIGRGTGTPSTADLTAFNRIAHYSTTQLYKTQIDKYTVEEKYRIRIPSSSHVGETITELGFGTGQSGGTYTHAMLKDADGSIISLVKTDTDILDIYGTIYTTYNAAANQDIVFNPSAGGMSDYLGYGFAIPIGDTNIAEGSYHMTVTKGTSVIDGFSSTSTLSVTESATEQFVSCFSIARKAFINTLNPSNFKGQVVVDKKCGIGDGINKNFILPIMQYNKGTLSVKVNGSPVSYTVKKIPAYVDTFGGGFNNAVLFGTCTVDSKKYFLVFYNDGSYKPFELDAYYTLQEATVLAGTGTYIMVDGEKQPFIMDKTCVFNPFMTRFINSNGYYSINIYTGEVVNLVTFSTPDPNIGETTAFSEDGNYICINRGWYGISDAGLSSSVYVDLYKPVMPHKDTGCNGLCTSSNDILGGLAKYDFVEKKYTVLYGSYTFMYGCSPNYALKQNQGNIILQKYSDSFELLSEVVTGITMSAGWSYGIIGLRGSRMIYKNQNSSSALATNSYYLVNPFIPHKFYFDYSRSIAADEYTYVANERYAEFGEVAIGWSNTKLRVNIMLPAAYEITLNAPPEVGAVVTADYTSQILFKDATNKLTIKMTESFSR